MPAGVPGGSPPALPAILQRLVEAAVDLVDARYGALGVLDDSRTRLAEFLTVGIDEETHKAIGHLRVRHRPGRPPGHRGRVARARQVAARIVPTASRRNWCQSDRCPRRSARRAA